MNENDKPTQSQDEAGAERRPKEREEHSEKPRHEHSSDESWSTPRWGPLLDEHDTGSKK